MWQESESVPLEMWAVLDTPAEENHAEVLFRCRGAPSVQSKAAKAGEKPDFPHRIKVPLILPYSTGEKEDRGFAAPEKLGENPLERLQNLLIDPELARCRYLIVELKEKLANLESQKYPPEKLIDLLIPVISELLQRKVAQSEQEEIALAIAPEIAAAIEQQIKLKQNAIANALAPEMGIAIKQQIMLERDVMVDALYPVIGNTIFKYMAEAIQSINEKIENSLSPQGIIRKLRAKIQGVSEAELILKEAMPNTIRAIFLIHKGSGLVISEVQPGSQKLESEMVAGMLTAIRSFVNDCIAHSGNVSEVDAIEYGNSKIMLEVAGYCYLAVVIEGEQSKRFIHKMRQALSAIVQSYGEPIESFDGDPATIPEQVNSLLEDLTHTSSKGKGKSPLSLIVSSIVLSLILLPWGIYQYRHAIDSRIEADTALALASTPELAVYRLTVNVDRPTLKLSGLLPNQYLRHKAEQIAKGIAPNLKFDNKILAVDVPPDPLVAAAEVKRVTSILNQMDGIAITAQYAKGLVTVEGTVSDFADAKKITQAFGLIGGVRSVTNTVELKSPLSAIRLYFDPGSAKLKPVDIGIKIIPIEQFLNRHPQKHLRIIGHSASNGNSIVNQQLALRRALSVRDALISQGIDPNRMQVVEMATPPLNVNYNQPSWLSRYVEVKPVTPTSRRK
jgi:outer membrane protein OmpA-like peptidoglycan-associated protein